MGEPYIITERIKELEDRLLQEHIKPWWELFEAAKRQVEAHDNLLLAAPDAAKMLRLATSTVRAMASRGKIKVVKEARRLRFPLSEIERIKDEQIKTRARALAARARWAERSSGHPKSVGNG